MDFTKEIVYSINICIEPRKPNLAKVDEIKAQIDKAFGQEPSGVVQHEAKRAQLYYDFANRAGQHHAIRILLEIIDAQPESELSVYFTALDNATEEPGVAVK